MIAKVRVGNYKGDDGAQEYRKGAFVEIDGKRYENVKNVSTNGGVGELTEATVTFTVNVGFIGDNEGEQEEDIRELARRTRENQKALLKFCDSAKCKDCPFCSVNERTEVWSCEIYDLLKGDA